MADVTFGLIDGPVYVRRDARGTFEELINTGTWQSVIAGRMTTGAVLGHHYHAYTIVCFYLLEGRSEIVTIDVGTKARHVGTIGAGQGWIFRPSEARAIRHLEDVQFLLLKSHRYDAEKPDLIEYRVE